MLMLFLNNMPRILLVVINLQLKQQQNNNTKQEVREGTASQSKLQIIFFQP
jgi:hypothetical protein